MAVPRETKKAETRTNLMRETARLVITRGTEHTTVADIAEAVGVSARTFHNYFSSREDALEEFAAIHAATLKQELENAGPGANLLETLESIVLDSFCGDQDSSVDNIVVLFRVCTILETLRGTDQHSRLLPENFPRDATIAMRGAIAIAWAAVDAYYQLPEPRDPSQGEQIVREAFTTARSLDSVRLP
ncbi:TetR/AcrR family transcriptional regulator [Corynebacterium lubricantis]|uniref:TetR/AcrR family transcriptional regulator n=1 Tax=Corynebacterium lubricantis TaxID=541095 RepID=UPI000366E51C|nr:TetR/AcrR family transcriptional regulator [Corynebacterium lubricantis]